MKTAEDDDKCICDEILHCSKMRRTILMQNFEFQMASRKKALKTDSESTSSSSDSEDFTKDTFDLTDLL